MLRISEEGGGEGFSRTGSGASSIESNPRLVKDMTLKKGDAYRYACQCLLRASFV